MTDSPVGVLDKDEIYLGGTYFPIAGAVRVTNITVTPNPVLFGDTTKQSDSQVMSSFIQSSNTGGSGIYKANARTDIDRFWTSEADTRFRDYFTLPPLAVDMGKPSGLTDESVTSCIDFLNQQYFTWANVVYRWQDATSSWSASERTLSTSPTDVIVFNNILFYAYTTAYDYRDSSGTWATSANAASFWAIWDTKLWRLALVSGVWTIYSSTDGTTWTAAKGTLPNGILPEQMIVYRDAGGNNVIAIVTDSGLWLYDSTNTRFLQSEVRYPRVLATQQLRATVFRDSKLYLANGDLGMLSVQAGNPFVVTPMGLDLEDGLVSTDSGVIDAVSADFNWVLAIVKAIGSSDDDDRVSGLAGPFDTAEWSATIGTSTLRAWNQGWHTLWKSGSSALSSSVIAVSSSYDTRRIYIGANHTANYITVPIGVHNPRHNPTAQFAAGPVTHTSPWFDYGSSVQRKIPGPLPGPDHPLHQHREGDRLLRDRPRRHDLDAAGRHHQRRAAHLRAGRPVRHADPVRALPVRPPARIDEYPGATGRVLGQRVHAAPAGELRLRHRAGPDRGLQGPHADAALGRPQDPLGPRPDARPGAVQLPGRARRVDRDALRTSVEAHRPGVERRGTAGPGRLHAQPDGAVPRRQPRRWLTTRTARSPWGAASSNQQAEPVRAAATSAWQR
jgi:hypothetical protein